MTDVYKLRAHNHNEMRYLQQSRHTQNIGNWIVIAKALIFTVVDATLISVRFLNDRQGCPEQIFVFVSYNHVPSFVF